MRVVADFQVQILKGLAPKWPHRRIRGFQWSSRGFQAWKLKSKSLRYERHHQLQYAPEVEFECRQIVFNDACEKLVIFFQKRTLPVTNVTNASAKNPSIISHFGEADFAHASPGIGSLREAGQPIHCRSLPSRQGPMPDSTMSDSGRREMVWNKCFDSDIYWNDVLIAFQWCFNASEICSFVFKCLKTS